MNRARAFSIVAALLLLHPGPASAQLDPKFDPKHLVTPPLRHVQVTQPERFKLANGMVVFLLENHDLPVVTSSFYVKTNPLWIPNEKVGLGSVTGEVMRSGGTATHSGDWLDDRLAAIGASMTTSIGVDLANAGFRCLSENTPEVLGLFAELLRAPDFPEDKIELSKVSLRRAIASRNDEMIPLLVQTAGHAVYGKGSAYARQPEYATIETIQREECRKLYSQVFEPSRVVLAVYGDFKADAMKKLVAAKLGDWKGAGVALPALPVAEATAASRLVFAPKEDVTQSGIILTHLGFRSDDPDFAAMSVLQTALGGGFQSRLVNRIRTERGLAYTTGAGAGDDYQRPGLFIAYSLTKSESTMVALDLLREEVRKVTEAPFTDQELQTAKESVLNQFAFNFEHPSSILFRSAYLEAQGYPLDFMDRYQRGVESVTAASVLEAARRKIHPDQMVAIVVGKEKAFDRPLTSAGLKLERVDIAIPPPPSKMKLSAATPEAAARAKAWLAKAAELAGGSAAWSSVKTMSLEQQQTLSMQGQSIALSSKLSWALPDRWLAVQKLPMGEMKQGYDGANGWMSAMNQVQDHPKVGSQVKEEYERSFFHLFGHADQVVAQAIEPQTVDGVTYQVAAITSDVLKDWTISFAPDGSLARMEYQGEGPQGPARITEIYADWKPAGKMSFPQQSKTLVDGKPLLEGKLVSVEFDVALDEGQFHKPSP